MIETHEILIETETETETETQTQTKTETETETETHRETETKRPRDRETKRQSDRETERQRHTQSDVSTPWLPASALRETHDSPIHTQKRRHTRSTYTYTEERLSPTHTFQETLTHRHTDTGFHTFAWGGGT